MWGRDVAIGQVCICLLEGGEEEEEVMGHGRFRRTSARRVGRALIVRRYLRSEAASQRKREIVVNEVGSVDAGCGRQKRRQSVVMEVVAKKGVYVEAGRCRTVGLGSKGGRGNGRMRVGIWGKK